MADLAAKVEALQQELDLASGPLFAKLRQAGAVLGWSATGTLQDQANHCLALIGKSDSGMSLKDKIEALKRDLVLEGSFADVLHSACTRLEIPVDAGKCMHSTADECLAAANGSGAGVQPDELHGEVLSMANDLSLGPVGETSIEEVLAAVGLWLGVEQSDDTKQKFAQRCREELGKDPSMSLAAKIRAMQDGIGLQPCPTRDGLTAVVQEVLGSDPSYDNLHQLADKCLAAIGIDSLEPQDQAEDAKHSQICWSQEDPQPTLPQATQAPEAMSFDLMELDRLVRLADAALQKQNDRNVLLFVGCTGAGKTTVIYHIAGKKLKATRHTSDSGIKELVYKPEDEQDLPGFVLGHSQCCSGTQCITSWLHPDSGVVYMDSAGHLDTRGCEVDVATTCSFKRMAAMGGFLRFVVVVRCDLLTGADRCNTLRSFCKVLSSYVADFQENSHAFCFLFNRVQALECYHFLQPGDSEKEKLDQARDEIHKRIQDTIKETSHLDEAWTVLNIINQSFLKENGNVIVFHPDWCSPQSCRDILEQFDQQHCLCNPGQVLQCNLTLAEEGAISRQFAQDSANLSLYLESEHVVEVEASIQKLRSVARFIPIKELTAELKRAEGLVQKKISQLTDAALRLAHEGSSFRAGKVMSDFSLAMAKQVLQQFDLVGQLKNIVDNTGPQLVEQLAAAVLGNLKVICQEVVASCEWGNPLHNPPLPVQSILPALVKLRIWSLASQVFADPFLEAEKNLHGYCQQVWICAEGALSTTSTAEKCIAFLHMSHVDAQAPELESAGIRFRKEEFPEAMYVEVLENALQSLQTSAQQAFDGMEQFCQERDAEKTDTLKPLRTTLVEVAQIRSVLPHWSVSASSPFMKHLTEAWDQLLRACVPSPLLVEIDRLVEDKDFIALEPCMAALRCFVDELPEAARESGSKLLADQKFMEARAALQSCCGRLQELSAEVMQQLLNGGVERLLSLLYSVRSGLWLDRYAEENGACFRNTLQTLEKELGGCLHKGVSRCRDALASSLGSFNGVSHNWAASDISSILKHMSELISFGNAFDSLQNVHDALWRELTNVLSGWLACYFEGLEPSDVSEFPASAVQRLLDVHSMMHSEEAHSVIARQFERVQSWLSEFDTHARQVFGSQGSYEEKDRLLSMVEKWTTDKLGFVTAQVMSLQEMRLKVQEDIEGQMQVVQQHLNCSPEAATEAVAAFEHVTTLNDSVWQQLKPRLEGLKHSIRLRHEDVGKELSEAMELCSFSAVRKYLIPAGSVDSCHCVSRLELVRDCIKSKIAVAKGSLETSPTLFVASHHRLKAAMHDVGDLLSKVDLEVDKELDKIKGIADDYVQKHCDDLLVDVRNSNVLDVLSKHQRLLEVHTVLTEVLSSRSEDSYRRACDKVSGLFSLMSENVNQFVKGLSAMAQSDEGSSNEAATRVFEAVLRSLQQLFAAKEWSKASDLYTSLLNELVRAVHQFHRVCFNKTLRTETFAKGIESYECLQGFMEKGLGKHIPTLDFCIADVIQQFRLKQKSWNHEFEQRLFTEQRIVEEVKPYLQRFLPQRSWSIWSFGTTTTIPWQYHEATMIIEEAIRRCNLEYLSTLDWSSIAAVVTMLRGIQKHLVDLLPQGILAAVRQSLEHVAAHFDLRVYEVVNAARNGEVMHLEICFRRFSMLLHHSHKAFLKKDINAACARVHQSILSLVNQSLSKFDNDLERLEVQKTIESLEKLEQLTGFFATKFAWHVSDCCDMCKLSEEGKDLVNLWKERFGGTEVQKYWEHCELLGVGPSQSLQEVIQAWKALSLRAHPDQNAGKPESTDIQKQLNAAHHTLVKEGGFKRFQDQFRKLFRSRLLKLPEVLKQEILDDLEAGSYCRVRTLLKVLPDLQHLPTARPDLPRLTAEMHVAVREEVNKLKGLISPLWEKQDFPALQKVLGKLAQMEQCFAAFGDIYTDTWRADVDKKVQSKLDTYVKQAREYLEGSVSDRDFNMMLFARQLLLLARVLDHLAMYRQLAMFKISHLLDSAQKQKGGTCYLFKLGMLLEQGKCGDLEDGRVCAEDQRLSKEVVSTFNHFSDVRTTIFNQQTASSAQKDLDEILRDFEVNQGNKVASVDAKVHPEELKTAYTQYKAAYDKFLHWWRTGVLETCPDKIVDDVMNLAAQVAPKSSKVWNSKLKSSLPILLAGVSAQYSICKSGDRILQIAGSTLGEDVVPDDVRQMLKQAHRTQILACLRLLGFDCKNASLSSHLMRIRTGEGKSIIVGMCAVVLSLLGFMSRCVCYSEYLSNRDFQDFLCVFQRFKVEDRVEYSKITKFSEARALARGNLRQFTEDLLLGRDISKAGKPEPEKSHALARESERPRPCKSEGDEEQQAELEDFLSVSNSTSTLSTDTGESSQAACLVSGASIVPQTDAIVESPGFSEPGRLTPLNGEVILLVDEVDVFFGPDFFGKTYNQVAEVALPEVRNLLNMIWANRSLKDDFRSLMRLVQESSEYAALQKRLADWDVVVESEVASMCAALKDMDKKEVQPEYIWKENRIGYKILDSVDADVSFGYTTAFHYLQLAESSTLRDKESALEKALQLQIPCARLSYARFGSPKILGVSGTVHELEEYKWEILTTYGLSCYSDMPSVYGDKNIRFLDQKIGNPITVSEEKDHHLNIAGSIRLQVSAKRAVIVFFENSTKLRDFLDSSHCRGLADVNVLQETVDERERDRVIRKAATSSQVTLATAVFGRGTDFFCHDPELKEVGGVHVIQTFLSLDKAEEVQIKGRTARQGEDGSYAMVLSMGDLEAFGISRNICALAPADQCGMLEAARTAHQKDVRHKVNKELDKAAEVDDLTSHYFQVLKENTPQKLTKAKDAFISLYKHVKKNPGGGCRGRARIVCLSDATGSMGGLWGMTKAHIGTMIQRIREIGGNNFEFLWAAYRDYSDGGLLIQRNAWTSDADELQLFVNGIVCSGGGDRDEAVERALLEARIEHDKAAISRVLLIADAPPHDELKGQKLRGHNHILETDYLTEANALKDRGVPVHCFRVGNCPDTLARFQQIASITGGEASDLTTDKLVDVVCTNTLMDIGGSELVAEYRARFGT